jgi:hypothetical protein
VERAVRAEQGVLAAVGEVDDQPDDEPDRKPRPGLPLQLQDEEQRGNNSGRWHPGISGSRKVRGPLVACSGR